MPGWPNRKIAQVPSEKEETARMAQWLRREVANGLLFFRKKEFPRKSEKTNFLEESKHLVSRKRFPSSNLGPGVYL